MAIDVVSAKSQVTRAAVVHTKRRVRLAPLMITAVSSALVAYGLWRLVSDLMPVPDLVLVERLTRQHKDIEAESLLRTILDRSPEHGDARQLLARVLARRGAKRACADELHKVPFWWPGKRDTQFLEGQIYYELGLAQQAEAAWMGCVKDDALHPADPSRVKGAAQSLVAQCMITGRLQTARDVLWEAYVQADPIEKSAVLGTRVRVELERIDPVESIQELEKQVAADRGNRDARRALALAYQLAHRPAEGDRLIEELLREAPNNVATYATWLSMLDDRNDPQALIECVARMPASVASAREVRIQIGRAAALEAQGKLRDAAQALEAALAADGFSEEAHFRMSRVAQRLGDQPDRVAEHRRAYQELHRAREALPRVLADFGTLGRTPSDPAPRGELIDRLAELCDTLGWKRLAREWRNVK